MNSNPLSVLDLVPMQSGIDSAGAIAESVALAQAAESLGLDMFAIGSPSTTTAGRWQPPPRK